MEDRKRISESQNVSNSAFPLTLGVLRVLARNHALTSDSRSAQNPSDPCIRGQDDVGYIALSSMRFG